MCLATLTPVHAQAPGAAAGSGRVIILDSAARSDRLLWLSLLQDRGGDWNERGGPLIHAESSLRELDVALSWAARQRALQTPTVPRLPELPRTVPDASEPLWLSPTFFEEIDAAGRAAAVPANRTGDDHEGLLLLNLRLAHLERESVAALRAGGLPPDALQDERRRLRERRDQMAKKLGTAKAELMPATLQQDRAVVRGEEQGLLQKRLSDRALSPAERSEIERLLKFSQLEP